MNEFVEAMVVVVVVVVVIDVVVVVITVVVVVNIVVIEGKQEFAGSRFPFLHLTVALSALASSNPALHCKSYLPLALGPMSFPFCNRHPLGWAVVIFTVSVVGSFVVGSFVVNSVFKSDSVVVSNCVVVVPVVDKG